MERGLGELGVQRPLGPRRSLSRRVAGSESGFSLVEVVLALVIIMIALAATTQVLTSTTEAVVNQQQLTSARGVLYSTVQAELTAESQMSATQFPVHGPSSLSPAQWPSNPTAYQIVSGFKFNIYKVWGWCAPTTSPPHTMGNYTSYAAPLYPSYEMAVKVTWHSLYPASVSQVTVIPLPPSDASTYSYPTSSTNCPASL